METLRENATADASVVVFSGDLDVTAEGLRRAIEERAVGDNRLVVDLSELSCLPTVAIDVLHALSRRLRELGGDLLVVVGAGEVDRIFSLTLLDRVFRVYRTRADALAALRAD